MFRRQHIVRKRQMHEERNTLRRKHGRHASRFTKLNSSFTTKKDQSFSSFPARPNRGRQDLNTPWFLQRDRWVDN